MKMLSRSHWDTVPGVELWKVWSEIADAEFWVHIAAPARAAEIQNTSALFLVDPPFLFGTATNVAFAGRLASELPPLVVVGVGYAPSEAHLLRRISDLTPTSRPDLDVVIPRLLGLEGCAGSGRSALLLDFLRLELQPELKTSVDIDQDAAIAGWSLGGLFALRALLTATETFRRCLAISPSLWWDNREVVRLIEERKRIPIDVDVLLCAGELEAAEHTSAELQSMEHDMSRSIPRDMLHMDMHADIQTVEMALKRASTTKSRIMASIFPGQTHASMASAGLTWGIRTLFGAISC